MISNMFIIQYLTRPNKLKYIYSFKYWMSVSKTYFETSVYLLDLQLFTQRNRFQILFQGSLKAILESRGTL